MTKPALFRRADDEGPAWMRRVGDHVVNNRFAAQAAEYEQATQKVTVSSLTMANHRMKCSEVAQKKVLNSLKTLTTLRVLVPEGLAPLTCVRLHGENRVV